VTFDKTPIEGVKEAKVEIDEEAKKAGSKPGCYQQ